MDIYLTTFYTRWDLPTSEILSLAQFTKALPRALRTIPTGELLDFLEDFSFLPDTLTHEHMTSKELPKKVQREVINAAVEVLSIGYRELLRGIKRNHPYIAYYDTGEITIWSTGGLTIGDDVWNGIRELGAVVSLEFYFPEVRNALLPWLLTPVRTADLKDTEKPEVMPLVTMFASSIMKHAALTHPDPNVRLSVVEDVHVPFEMPELVSLSEDSDSRVAGAALARIEALNLS